MLVEEWDKQLKDLWDFKINPIILEIINFQSSWDSKMNPMIIKLIVLYFIGF